MAKAEQAAVNPAQAAAADRNDPPSFQFTSTEQRQVLGDPFTAIWIVRAPDKALGPQPEGEGWEKITHVAGLLIDLSTANQNPEARKLRADVTHSLTLCLIHPSSNLHGFDPDNFYSEWYQRILDKSDDMLKMIIPALGHWQFAAASDQAARERVASIMQGIHDDIVGPGDMAVLMRDAAVPAGHQTAPLLNIQ